MPKGYCKECDCAAERADQGKGVFDCHFLPPGPTGQFSRVNATDFCFQYRPAAKLEPPRSPKETGQAQRVVRETRPATPDATRAKAGKTKQR